MYIAMCSLQYLQYIYCIHYIRYTYVNTHIISSDLGNIQPALELRERKYFVSFVCL